MGLGFAASLVLVVGGYYLYNNVWQLWRNSPPGYQMVCEKDHLFSKCWVRLLPGDNFLVQVPPALHERLRVGSRLRLTYTVQGEQVSVVELG